jgi:hypothetical protein
MAQIEGQQFPKPALTCTIGCMVLGRLAIAVCMLLGPGVAAADDSTSGDVSARLVYQRDAGAESCADEAALRAEVARRVGFNPFKEDASRVIVCRVDRTVHGLRARIELGNDTDHLEAARELLSKRADCQELSEALLVALSIAINPLVSAARIDPEKEEETAPPESEPAQRGDSAVVPPLAREPASIVVAAPPPRPGVEWLVGADGAVAAGLNPGLAYAATIDIGLAGRRYSAEGDLRLAAPSSVAVGRGSLRVWQWAVLLAACAHRGVFSACLLGSGGMIYGAGQGFAISEKSQSPQVAAGARGAVEYPLAGRRLRLRAAVDLTAALTRTHFVVSGVDAWVSPPAAAVLALGLSGAFF